MKRKAMSLSRFESASDLSNSSNSRSKGSRIARKGSSDLPSPLKKKKPSTALISMKSEVSLGRIVLDLPIRTKSEANCFESWRLKHKRHKDQQRIVAYALKPLRGLIKLPCKIMLTRFAPDELDAFDNLPVSFKYIVDAVCAIITGEYRAGKADSDKRIKIACDQVKSKEYGIRIEITY